MTRAEFSVWWVSVYGAVTVMYARGDIDLVWFFLLLTLASLIDKAVQKKAINHDS